MKALILRAFQAWGRGHVRRLARRGLDGVYVQGLDQARRHLREGPVLFAANHVSWWDGLMVVLMNEVLGASGRVLMNATRLRSHAFFAAFGAIPIGDNPRQELHAAAEHLAGPGRALWIFPQGRQRPEVLRPLGFLRGVATLSRLSGARVMPVALRYPMRESPNPTVIIRFGEPLSNGEPEPLEAAVAAMLDERWPEDEPPGELIVAPEQRGDASTRALSWLYGSLFRPANG